MTSHRETIYERLEAILVASGCFDTVVRNEFIEDEASGRIAMLFDGDEEPKPNTGEGRNRPVPGWAQPMQMGPEVYILSNATLAREDIGPWLAWATDKVKYHITHDAPLLALLHNRDPVLYLGMATGLSVGRSLAGEASMKFMLTYVDQYEDPGAEPAPITPTP